MGPNKVQQSDNSTSMTDTDMEEEFGDMSETPNRGGEGGKSFQNKTIEVYSLLHYASSCGDVEIFKFVLY